MEAAGKLRNLEEAHKLEVARTQRLEEELQKCRDDVSALCEQHSATEDALKSQHAHETQELERSLAEHAERIKVLTVQVNQDVHRAEDADTKIIELEEQVKRMTSQELDIGDLRLELAALEANKAKVDKDLEAAEGAQKALEVAQAEISHLERRLAEVTDHRNSLVSVNTTLNQDRDRLEAESREAKEQLEKTSEWYHDTLRTLHVRDGVIMLLTQELENARAHRAAADAGRDEARAERDTARNETTKAHEERHEARAERDTNPTSETALRCLASLTRQVIQRQGPLKVNILGTLLEHVVAQLAPPVPLPHPYHCFAISPILAWWNLALALERLWPGEQLLRSAREALGAWLAQEPLAAALVAALTVSWTMPGFLAERAQILSPVGQQLGASDVILLRTLAWEDMLVVDVQAAQLRIVARGSLEVLGPWSLGLSMPPGHQTVLQVNFEELLRYFKT